MNCKSCGLPLSGRPIEHDGHFYCASCHEELIEEEAAKETEEEARAAWEEDLADEERQG